MSTMPKVSVVTTTYNDMDNLCRIMEEVRKQTYKNIEHIIVDGGSTDGTVEMLTRLSEEQPGAFRWISGEFGLAVDQLRQLVHHVGGLHQRREVQKLFAVLYRTL